MARDLLAQGPTLDVLVAQSALRLSQLLDELTHPPPADVARPTPAAPSPSDTPRWAPGARASAGATRSNP